MAASERRRRIVPLKGRNNASPIVAAEKHRNTTAQTRWERCAACTLNVVFIADAIVMSVNLPLVVMVSDTLALSFFYVLAAQLMFLIPQAVCTLWAERLAIRLGGVLTYSLTLLATSISLFISSVALRQRSFSLYLCSRLVGGVFRHTTTISAVATHQYPELWDAFDAKKFILHAFVFAALLGGVLGDYGPGIAGISEGLSLVEFTVSMAVGVVSLTVRHQPKTLPTVHTLTAYQNWLLKQSLSATRHFVPVVLTSAAALASQLMYPFVDRRVLHLSFSVVGLHLAVDLLMQILLVPVVVAHYGARLKSLCWHFTTLLIVGVWISPWTADYGVALYLFTTAFLTDLPVAVLQSALGEFAVSQFAPADGQHARRLQLHVRKLTRQWYNVFYVVAQSYLSIRVDENRLLSVPFALGAVAFMLTHRVLAAATATVLCFAVLVYLPPIDDRTLLGAVVTRLVVA
ncbi:hypothetical protein TRVL_01978 [Trypanosoma vivax]|nr:hypothetical protein TRVL_01978 [Trypanosoma vivax]